LGRALFKFYTLSRIRRDIFLKDMTHHDQVKLTKEGYEALKQELGVLVDEKRPKIVERLAFARQQGDLTENSDYTNAKEELEFLDGRISELETVLKTASIVDGRSNHKSDGVAVGTTVTVKANGDRHIYEIVGEWEADPVNKKISHQSPLGLALVGKKVGEKVQVEAPAGKVTYEILAIE
jgi:transcription elongation factor GreA